jgi:uracil-DNA glycosylase family 4
MAASRDPRPKPSARAARQRLESLKRAGVTHLPKRRGKQAEVEAAPAEATSPIVKSSPVPAPKQPVQSTSNLVQLDIIRDEIAGCTCCKELASTRNKTVPGIGNPQARLCFLGEAPGADEDRQGEPFVGRAGQLLTKIIEACTLKREDVFILNVLKCRPPNNRPPLPDEVANCSGFLDRQLAVIQPEFICCLGTTAAQSLLKTDQTIGKLRGRFHESHGATVLCTYHPSYLLRNPNAKRDVWEDMKILMRRMGIELA